MGPTEVETVDRGGRLPSVSEKSPYGLESARFPSRHGRNPVQLKELAGLHIAEVVPVVHLDRGWDLPVFVSWYHGHCLIPLLLHLPFQLPGAFGTSSMGSIQDISPNLAQLGRGMCFLWGSALMLMKMFLTVMGSPVSLVLGLLDSGSAPWHVLRGARLAS